MAISLARSVAARGTAFSYTRKKLPATERFRPDHRFFEAQN